MYLFVGGGGRRGWLALGVACVGDGGGWHGATAEALINSLH